MLVYGVLHYRPDPQAACSEIARTEGVYLGSENNETIFRAGFDLLQRSHLARGGGECGLDLEEQPPEMVRSEKRGAYSANKCLSASAPQLIT